MQIQRVWRGMAGAMRAENRWRELIRIARPLPRLSLRRAVDCNENNCVGRDGKHDVSRGVGPLATLGLVDGCKVRVWADVWRGPPYRVHVAVLHPERSNARPYELRTTVGELLWYDMGTYSSLPFFSLPLFS